MNIPDVTMELRMDKEQCRFLESRRQLPIEIAVQFFADKHARVSIFTRKIVEILEASLKRSIGK